MIRGCGIFYTRDMINIVAYTVQVRGGIQGNTDLAFLLTRHTDISSAHQRQPSACVRIFPACVVILQTLAAFVASLLFCVRHRAIPLGTCPVHRE